MTLDPPGRMAVVGAGALGIETSLYGRFLGYDVTLLEAVAIGHSLSDQRDAALSMLPNRCLSPLAVSALKAQYSEQDGDDYTLPMTMGQWIDQALVPLTQTDLMRGRVWMPARVTEIHQVPVPTDDEEQDSDEIPPDFRLTFLRGDCESETLDVEAVILAVGATCDIHLGFVPPVPYLWRIGATSYDDDEKNLEHGRRDVVQTFARLAGRPDLDLYRPRRV